MDRIGLLVQLVGDKAAVSSLRDILKLKNEISNKRLQLRVEKNNVAREMNNITRTIQDLERHARKLKIGVDDKEIIETYKRINELYQELDRLRTLGRDMQIDVNMNTQALSIMREMEREAVTLRDALSGIGSVLSTLGGAFQSIGGIFNTDVLSYVTQTLTQLGTQAVMGNLSAASSRFDTMSTYVPYMNAVGISTDKATASLQEINDVIAGLPIGLDEAAIDIRRTTMLMNGDVDTATKFVEGFNQALIAGGAPEQMRNYAKLEIQRLLSVGDLATGRQWNSLLQGLGVSVSYLKDAMGYTDMSTADFEALLRDGDAIDGTEVIQGFANLADDAGLQELIKIYRGTVESGLSNLKFAFQRGLANVFEAGNETMESAIGMNISEYLMSGRDIVDNVFLEVADWIRENPDTIASIFGEIEKLGNMAVKFDWGKLATNVIGAAENLFDIITGIIDIVPDWAIRQFITFSMVWASPLGKAFTALGSFFQTIAFMPLPNVSLFTRNAGKMGKMVGSLKGMGRSFLGVSAFLGVIAEIGLVIFELAKVAETVASVDLDGFWKNFGKISGFAGILTGVATAMTGIFSAISAIPGGGLVVLAGEGLAAGFVALIGEMGLVIDEFAKVADDISSAKLPSDTKLKKFFEVLNTVTAGVSDAKIRLGSKWRTKQINAIIDMLENLSEALPALDKIGSADIDMDSVSGSIQSVLGVYKVIDEEMEEFLDDYQNRASLRLQTWADSKIVENITAILEDLSTTIDTMDGIRDKLNEYGFMNSPNGEGNLSLTRIIDTLETLAQGMTEVSEAINQKKGPIKTIAQEIKASIETDIIKDWNESMSAIAELIETLHSNEETFKLYAPEGHGHNRTQNTTFYAMKESIVNILEQISNGKDGILDSIYTSVTAIGKRMEKQNFDGIAAIVGDMQSAIEDIGLIFDTISTYSDSMTWVGGNARRRTSFSETIANINSLIGQIENIDWEGLGGISTGELTGNVQAINTALVTIMQLVPRMATMSESLKQVESNNVTARLQSILNDLLATLQSVPEDMSDVTERVKKVQEAVSQVETMANTLSELTETLATIEAEGGALSQLETFMQRITAILGGENVTSETAAAVATAIQGISSALTEMAGIDISGLVDQIEDLAENMKDAKKKSDELKLAIAQLSQTAKTRSGWFSSFIDSLGQIASEARSAYTNVYSLSVAMSGLTDKSVTLTVNTSGLQAAITAMNAIKNLASNLTSSVGSIFRASGGRVEYHDNGGIAGIMKPRGTDTVPAMLTPGEWVINRHAVNLFGDEFMQKVNRMDINGAMDALMSSSRWRGGTYVTNNYNNQSVTQHFHGNKDSKSSYRMANRYLGAL